MTSLARTSAAERQRRRRARQRNGQAVLQIEVKELDLALALQASGFGDAGLEDDRAALTRALEKRIRAWLVTRDNGDLSDVLPE